MEGQKKGGGGRKEGGRGGEKGRNFRQSEQHKQRSRMKEHGLFWRTGNGYDCGRECEGKMNEGMAGCGVMHSRDSTDGRSQG